MSLQVWLPLTKDLRNQGLKNVTVTNNGATYSSTGGKLGGCYILDGTNDRIEISNLPQPQKISVAMWFKRGANTNTRQFLFTAWNGITLELGTSGTVTCSVATADGQVGYCTTNTAITTSTGWTHICFTFENGVGTKLYINGNFQMATAVTKPISWNTTTGNIGYFSTYLNASVNDFRLYDHTLSQMEVKELSKGLVLHYPLNRGGWGQENLVWNTHWDNMPTSWSNWGSPPTREIVNINGKRWLHVKSSDRWQGYSQNQSNRSGVGEITAGEKLTLSCYAYSTTSLTNYPPIGIHWTDGSSIISQSWPQCNLTTTPQKFVTTLTVPNGVSAFNIMVGNGSGTVSGVYEVWISEVKIERGEIATPWCPNSSDTLATTMDLNGTTEYDCSGFCNNGTRTGSFSWTSDTPRYSVSTQFTRGASSLTTPSPSFITEGSVAMWVKVDTLGTSGWLPFSGQDGSHYCLATASGTGNFYNDNIGSGTILYYYDGQRVSAPTSLTTGWHHVVITGINLSSWTMGRLNAYGSQAQTNWNSTVKYSDFRIYATALSAEDVLELYHTAARIDNVGNTYVYQYIET